MRKINMSLEVDAVINDAGNISVLIWPGNDYTDPYEVEFSVADILDSLYEDYAAKGGKIDAADIRYLSLIGEAFENNVHIAVDALRMKL
jgi:hypothetical protein